MIEQKLPASILNLAKELSLSVMGGKVLMQTRMGSGLLLDQWLCMRKGAIVVELTLRRLSEYDMPRGGTASLFWDGANNRRLIDAGGPPAPLTEADALEIVQHWADMKILREGLDTLNQARAEIDAAQLVERLQAK